MLSTNRKFNFTAELLMHKSNVPVSPSLPKDDKVNWLFLKIKEHKFSFVYKIQNPEEAKYDELFMADLAFTMDDEVQKFIESNYIYEIFRGQELIGKIKIIHTSDMQG